MNVARPDERRAGRELALAVMCHLESYPRAEHADAVRLLLSSPPAGDGDGEDVIARFVADDDVRRYAEALVGECSTRLVEIDEVIEATSRTWRLSRMDRVDRNVVRLATAELLARADVPRAAILSEAVRLAGRYGSDRSVTFVNGLVEALAKRIRPAPEAGP
jgi:N utilization substance protein B